MYCSYNVTLFKPFVSQKTKIKPALASDWEMIPANYRGNSGFKLYSKSLGQEVADIDLYRFLDFSKDQKLVIDSLMLQGEYIIGNDRSVYTRKMYDKWKGMFDKRVDEIIEKKDLIVGHSYETPCGSKFIYIGKFYNINFKAKLDDDDGFVLTKQKLVHLVADSVGGHPTVLNQKVRRDKGMHSKWTDESIEKSLNKIRTTQHIAWMSKEKIQNPKIVLKEQEHEVKYHTESYWTYDFMKAKYNGVETIFAKNWEGYSYNCSVSDYDGYFKDAMKKYKDQLVHIKKNPISRSGYNHTRPSLPIQETFGIKADVQGIMGFDPDTMKYLVSPYPKDYYGSRGKYLAEPIAYYYLALEESN